MGIDTPTVVHEAETGGIHHHPEVDWQAAADSPEFRELVRQRRRFVVPATVFYLGWYVGFVLLCGYAQDFMGSSVYEGFTVGYALALSQFVMVWGLAVAYVRFARNVLDPLSEAAAARALERSHLDHLAEGTQAAASNGRFTRPVEALS